jgi:hypothetical protein
MVRSEAPINVSDQRSLPGFGPDSGDEFRFTWWNTQVSDTVWIENRGRWRPGVVKRLGREFVQVAIVGGGKRQPRVRKLYCELRRRR